MPIPPFVQAWGRERDPNPFDREDELRPLRVFVDRPLMAGDVDGSGVFAGYPRLGSGLPGFPSAAAILRNLFKHEWIEGLFITDDSDAIGGVVLDEPDLHDDNLPFTVRWSENTAGCMWMIYYKDRIDTARKLATRHGVSFDEALEGVVFQHVASCADSDVVVTNRPWLLKARKELPGGYPTRVVSPEEGLATTALFLRWRERRFRLGDAEFRWGQTSMRWAAASAILPSWWKWRHACCAQSRADGDETLEWLSESLLTRVSRVLWFRDQIHALSGHDLRRDRDEMLENLDSLLYSLVGAFDIAARVADMCLKLGTDKHQIGWQKKKWRKELSADAKPLYDYIDPTKPMQLAFNIATRLRNSVHNEALRLSMQSSAQGEQPYVRLPADLTAELNVLLAGTLADWGFAKHTSGSITMDVCKFVEKLTPTALSALDDLLSKTPVDRFHAYTPDPRLQKSPDGSWRFSSTTAHRLRLLYGL